MISRATELKGALLLCATLALLFIALPQLDQAASRLFFDGQHWLVPRDTPWLQIPYRGLPRLGQVTVLTLIVLLMLSLLPSLKRRLPRVIIGFWLAAALLGPVLLVDLGIKDASGRARPINIVEFGGNKTFSPAFVPAQECSKNCSFVSGHVATASFLMAFGWLAAPNIRRRWLIASLASGGLMGLARMLPGGHFLSDVIFAWFAVYFSLWLVEWGFRRVGWFPQSGSY